MILDEDIKQITSDSTIEWGKLAGANVLVTGATGLIGSLCIKTMLALDLGVHVFALVRNRERAEAMLGKSVEYVVGDIRTPINISSNIDYVIHCASNTKSKVMIDEPIETFDIVVTGTRNILQYCNEQHVKGLLFVSSMEVYGVTQDEQNPVSEEQLGFVSLNKPRSSYPEGKRAAEFLCNAYYEQYQVPVKIARLAMTFGAGAPSNDNRVSVQFAKSVISGQDIVLHTKGLSMSNFCYTSDAIRGLFLILLNGQDGETYNVCNDDEIKNIGQIAQMVADEVAGGKIKVVFDIPKANKFGYAPDSVLKLSAQKLRKIGWTPRVGLKNAYERLVQYLNECEV